MSQSNDDPNDKFDKFIRNFDETLKTDTSTIKTIKRKSAQSFDITYEDEDSVENLNEPQSPIKQISKISDPITNKLTSSPILSTPTKPNRNSISLDNQPLSTNNNDNNNNNSLSIHKRGVAEESARRINLLSKRVDSSPIESSLNTPTNRTLGGLTRSNTMSSVRLGSKRGLNLNLSINKQRPSPIVNKLKSPETPNNNTNVNNHHHHLNNTNNNNTNNNINNPINESTSQLSSANKFDRSRRRTNSSLSSHSSVVQDLKNNDFNDSLRELALKEMKIIELKDQLKLMQQRIDKEEEELKSLKNKIGNNFKELSPVQNQMSPSIHSNLTPTSSNNYNQYKISPTRDLPKQIKQSETDNSSKRQSVWSKPINFLNQFDQILQTEIERLNREAFPQSQSKQQQQQQQQQQHPDTLTEQENEDEDTNKTTRGKTDDVLNSVSNSIWSFVSDVKHGLLGDDYSNDDETSKKVDNPIQSQSQSQNQNQSNQSSVRNYDLNEQEMINITNKKL